MMIALGAGIAALAGIGAGVGIGIATGKAVDAVARSARTYYLVVHWQRQLLFMVWLSLF